MSDIYSLLKISEGVLKDFHLQAGRVADHQTEKVINQNTRKLKEIEDRMVSDKGIQVSTKSIEEVINKVKDLSAKQDFSKENWSMRELRIVSYYMSLLVNNEDTFRYALSLISNAWRNMYFNGLLFFIMDKWAQIDPTLRKETTSLLIRQLKEYNDHNKRLVTLKNHVNLLEEAGPMRLSALIISKKMDVREAPLIIGYKQTAFQQSYYSDVIVNYVRQTKLDDLDSIEEIFEEHKLSRTKKLTFAELVIQAENNGDAVFQTKLSRFINRMLGDVTITSTWAPFPGATQAEADTLYRAKTLVNMWFTRKIIETFFEVCVQDRDRKIFWLNYVNYVKSFKIVGSTTVKRLLQSDSRIGTMFFPHFIETNSTYSQTAALILFIRNKVIIEFSDTGALYVYNESDRQVEFIRKGKRYIDSTNDLKRTSIGGIVDKNDYGTYNLYEEGRMTHQGNWQSRLTMWINKILLSKSNISSSRDLFGDSFKAQPFERIMLKANSHNQEDIPEYLRTNVKKATKEDKPQNPKGLQKTANSGNVNNTTLIEYETNVQYNISSKWVFNNRCRIVCGKNGFFINVEYGRKFVHIGNLPVGVQPNGSIWIKKPDPDGWFTVSHASSYKEYIIGYIKLKINVVIFRDQNYKHEAKKINLY